MSDIDTAPAAETEIAESAPPSISELIAERHQTLPDHEGHLEVGEDPDDEPAPAAAAVAKTAPAPGAEAAPAAKVETPVDPAAKPEKEQPFWYRKEIEKERKARQQAERELEAARRQAPQPQRQPGEEDDPHRPLTRAELEAYRQHDALIGRLERSEERFVDKLGEETFEKTRDWLATRPDIEEWALKQRDPWASAHSQYRKEELAAEIGEDPKAWQEKERQRIRDEVRAEMEAEASGQPAPTRQAPQMRAPPPAPASTARAAAPRDPATGKVHAPSR
jgi:hypothetical protein